LENLKTGKFYGQTNQTINLDFATITDTEYTHDKVDWHYHDTAYFTFILDGKVIEGNKKEVYNCTAGSLLFHNWQDPHYNIKPKGYTRGFHIELQEDWFNIFKQDYDQLQGSFEIASPDVKFLFYKLFKETKVNDGLTAMNTEAMLLQVLGEMQGSRFTNTKQKPAWVSTIRELLHDDVARKFTLTEFSALLGLHPAHLSRDFSRYFGCNLGEYIRKIRVQHALSLMPNANLSLTDIALSCGFADQSHFTRSFKAFNGVNAKQYCQLLSRQR
jgi:AraC family transcriptional regulator